MAVPTTLHIGRPCMLCTPGCIRGPRGGQAHRRAAGWVGGGAGLEGRGEGGSRWPRQTSFRGPHTWSRSRERRLAPSVAAATPARPCGPRTTPLLWRRPPRGGTSAAGAAGATPGRAPPHTTRRVPSGSRPAPRRLPHVGPRAWRRACRPCPFAGAPLGLGSLPRPPRRGRHPAGLDQRPPAPGAHDRGVGRRGGGLWRPSHGCHPRRHRPVPLQGACDPSYGGGGTARAGLPRHIASRGPRGALALTPPGPGGRAAGPTAPT